MDIKLLGVEFKTGAGITIAELFDFIITKKGTPVVLYKYGRFVYVKDLGTHYAGLLITTKDRKKYIEFTQNAGVAKLEPKDVTQGAQLADFNFFLINKKNGRGLYQYYHGSCSLDTFGAVCLRHYHDLKKQKVKDEIAKVKNPSVAQIKKINSSYAGNLSWSFLVKPENFNAMVKKLKYVKMLKVTITTLALKNTIFSPIASRAKRMTQSFRFPMETEPTQGLLDELDVLIEKPEVNGTVLEGEDENGHRQTFKVDNNPDSFGVYDYDEIAGKMDLDPDDFTSSDFMKELLKVAHQKKSLFHN